MDSRLSLMMLFPELFTGLPDIGVKDDVQRLLSHLLPIASSMTQGRRCRDRFAAVIRHPGELEELEHRGQAPWHDHDALDRELDELVAHDEVRAVAVAGRLAGSDTPTEEAIWHVARWRRDKCIWWRSFNTRAEALEAAGLSE